MLYNMYVMPPSYPCKATVFIFWHLDAIIVIIYMLSLICSSDESLNNSSSSSSSIIFQSLSQAPTDATHSVEVLPEADVQPVKGICPTQEMGQVVCPKTMRRIPKSYVPCVFLGQQDLVKTSKCPAKGLLLEEQSSEGSAELNNNSHINGECQQWPDICTSKPSKEVFAQTVFSNFRMDCLWTAFSLHKNKIFFLGF